jgi:cellulose synthase (UDP-forming)
MAIAEHIPPKADPSYLVQEFGIPPSLPPGYLYHQALPTPPSASERYSYVNPNRSWAYLGLLACGCSLYSSCWFIWQSHLWVFGLYILLTVAWTFPHFIFILSSKNFDIRDHIQVIQKHLPTSVKPNVSTQSSVDVFIPTCGETLSIIENTFYHASKLNYPCLNIYVLDDGGDGQVRKLAQKYGVQYLSRSDRGQMKKREICYMVITIPREILF